MPSKMKFPHPWYGPFEKWKFFEWLVWIYETWAKDILHIRLPRRQHVIPKWSLRPGRQGGEGGSRSIALTFLNLDAGCGSGCSEPLPTRFTRNIPSTHLKEKQNSIQEEIKSRLKSGNDCCHSVQNLLASSLLSKNIKIKIYRNIILPVVVYGCETWSLTLRE